jgi:hypothetical protein
MLAAGGGQRDAPRELERCVAGAGQYELAPIAEPCSIGHPGESVAESKGDLIGDALRIAAVVAIEAVGETVLKAYVEHDVWVAVGLCLCAATALFVPYQFRVAHKARQADEKVRTALAAVHTRDGGLELLHKAAEAIRRAVIGHALTPGGSYTRDNFQDDVRKLLETRLREYLHERLGRDVEYAVTIKWIEGDELTAVFRDSKQPPPRADALPEKLAGNYFYERLSRGAHNRASLRCLVVHDTQASEIDEPLRSRGHAHGYRSCLAVPLNLPEEGKGLAGFGLVGFLSIDAPKSFIFQDLFEKEDPRKELGCEGQNHRPKAELNLLYGLADTVAAIYLLAND